MAARLQEHLTQIHIRTLLPTSILHTRLSIGQITMQAQLQRLFSMGNQAVVHNRPVCQSAS